MAICTVLGLGPSLSLYEPDDSLTFGVNDIWRFIKTDYIVCVDKQNVFSPDRLKIIQDCRPIKFYSQIDEYSVRRDFQKIELQPYYPDYSCQLNTKQLPKSFCSPFVACAVAFKFHNATEIHVYGVDMTNHPNLDKKMCDKIKVHFRNLKIALRMKGCELSIHGDGILKKL